MVRLYLWKGLLEKENSELSFEVRKCGQNRFNWQAANSRQIGAMKQAKQNKTKNRNTPISDCVLGFIKPSRLRIEGYGMFSKCRTKLKG